MSVLYFLSTISSMESNALTDLFNVDQLIPALSESISQIMKISDEHHTRTQMKSIENWLIILSEITKRELLKFENGENDEKFNKMNEILFKILRPYIHSYNLIPLDEQISFCIHQSLDIMLMFQRNEFQINSELNWVIIQIIRVLSSGKLIYNIIIISGITVGLPPTFLESLGNSFWAVLKHNAAVQRTLSNFHLKLLRKNATLCTYVSFVTIFLNPVGKFQNSKHNSYFILIKLKIKF